MKTAKSNIAKHLLLIVGITVLLVFLMLYPFLPSGYGEFGGYDALATPLSTMANVFGIVGLLLVPVGIAWLAYELRSDSKSKRHRFALAAILVGLVVAFAVSVAGAASGSMSLGVLAFALALYAMLRLRALKTTTNADRNDFSVAPLYLIALPVLVFASQLALVALAAPLMEWSRNRVIANSTGFINDIEAYHAVYGRYPATLAAQWKDYYPDLVGVDKYHYSPHGESYNLFFEQPRLFLDRWGTREWVVYNPLDEHRMYSHASWFLLLSPEVLERSQGWYAVHDAGVPHWKYFFFD